MSATRPSDEDTRAAVRAVEHLEATSKTTPTALDYARAVLTAARRAGQPTDDPRAGFRDEDIRRDIFRAKGQDDPTRGDVGVRLTHLPTGTVAEGTSHPTALGNIEEALHNLRAALDGDAATPDTDGRQP